MAGCTLCLMTPLAGTWHQAAAASAVRLPVPWTSKPPADASANAAQPNAPIMQGHALRQSSRIVMSSCRCDASWRMLTRTQKPLDSSLKGQHTNN